MPLQTVPTKLSVDEWARIMGINPLHFRGVQIEAMRNTCGEAWFTYDWQDSERVGRDSVAQAIAEAEAQIEQLVGYRLLPSWEEDEWRPTVRPRRRDLYNTNSRDVRGLNQIVEARWGHLVTGGVRSAQLLDTIAVSYANDGTPPTSYKNDATVALILNEEIDDCEIALYYPGHGNDEQWRIRPVRASHTVGLLYTVHFRREQALAEQFIDSYNLSSDGLRAADGDDDLNFLTTVEVWRVYNDPQQQATLMWEPGGGNCGCSGGATCGQCAYSTQTGCLMLRGDPRLSLVVYQAATWNLTDLAFETATWPVSRQPDIVRLWYYAGWRNKGSRCPVNEMDGLWARTVAYLAASKLPRPPCPCLKSQWEHWAVDLAFSGGATELGTFRMSQRDLDNPIGTKRGAVNAWKQVMRPGVVVTRGAFDQ